MTSDPSWITDHPFHPPSVAEWFGTCSFERDGVRCGLAEAAHSETTLPRKKLAPAALPGLEDADDI